MPKLRTILPALAFAILAATLHAQLTPLQDPANLAGERVSPQDPADTLPLNHGAPALQQLLAKLRTRASLMLIVAHPDDEDGGLLTYESRGQGARVAMLTLTRGEGGQNLMSADFDDALGLIRTQELLAADRYFGVDQFFGTEVDFGFSKTKEESFAKWTHDRVLYDAVRAVRLYRPLVIASVFVGGPTDGHGQHQVAGEIAQEVFVAAADPNVFPEMIAQGLLPWAPLKVYARVPFSRVTPEGMYDYATGKTIPTRFHNYVTGADSTAVPTATVLIHEGDKPTDSTLAAAMGGDTFVQFARKGLALQKTQIGPNVRLAPTGAFDAGYTLMASRIGCIDTKAGCPTFATASPSLRWASTKVTTERSLFDGIDTTFRGIATLALRALPTLHDALVDIDQQFAQAQRLFDPAHPELTAPSLSLALHKLHALLPTIEQLTITPEEKENILHELRIKTAQTNNALALSLGLRLEAILSPNEETATASALSDTLPFSPRLMAGAKIVVQTHFTTGGLPVVAYQGQLVNWDSRRIEPTSSSFKMGQTQTARIEAESVISSQYILDLSDHVPWSSPYFDRPVLQQPFYRVLYGAGRNAPQNIDHPFIARQIVLFNKVPIELWAYVTGGTRLPSGQLIREPLTLVPPVTFGISPSIIVNPKGATSIALTTTFQSPLHLPITLEINAPPSWRVPDRSMQSLQTTENDHVFKLNVPSNVSYVEEIRTQVLLPSNTLQQSFRPVGYPGIPTSYLYTQPTTRIIPVDLHTAPNLRVAYLPGTGDTVPEFLPNLGVTPTLLTLKDLNPNTLNKYDAILLGVRAYAAHPELAGPGSQPLLDYAKQGGVVILQYNTARFGDAEAAFPIDVPGDPAHNVVEEVQPVTLLHPGAPLLTWPNRITPADFDGWVAERGHGFAASWSSQYQPLLETHDVGQDPQQGGLLLARTSKGAYIYCAFALYRQLPEGVPGAYRLLANLLSYAKNPAFLK